MGATEGVSGACVNIKEESAALRFNVSGYFDRYNDWGFAEQVACRKLTTNYGRYA